MPRACLPPYLINLLPRLHCARLIRPMHAFPYPRRQAIKVWDTCRQHQVVSWVRRIEGALHTYSSEYLSR